MGKVKETFRLPLEFQLNIGTTDVASTGVKALTGGLGGMLKAGAKLAMGSDRKDDPVVITKESDGNLVVRGKQHLLAFDSKTEEIIWSDYFAAPGVSGLGVAAMVALTAMSVTASQISYAAGQSSLSNHISISEYG